MEKEELEKEEFHPIKIFFLGLIITLVLSVLCRYGLPLGLWLYKLYPPYTSIFLTILSLYIFINTVGCFLYSLWGKGIPRPETAQLIMSFICVLCISSIFPALFIFWLTDLANYRKAIEIAVFLTSTSVGIIFYLLHRKKFISITETISYFSGVCLGPTAIVQILL